MKTTGHRGFGWAGLSLGLVIALALTWGCGGGRYGTPDESGGGDTPSTTYAEFVGKRLVIHFETPIEAEASASKALDASMIAITEDLTGLPLTPNRIVLSSDGLTADVFAAFRYLTSYRIGVSGLANLAKADGDLDLTAETPANPASLSGGRYGDIFMAMLGFAAIFNGPDLLPQQDDSNEVDFESLVLGSWTYTDPFTDDGCLVGSASLNIPAYLQIGDGHSFMVGRVGTSEQCGDIFAEGDAGISVEKGMEVSPRTTFLYFEDKDAGPVAEFMPVCNTMIMAFPLVSPPLDFNGDGIADFGFIESCETELDLDKADPGFRFYGYEYMRIFLGRGAGGFQGRIESSEADVTIPVAGFSETKSVYDEWVVNLGLPAAMPYYPAFAHGDLDGDGMDEIALAIYDTSLGRMVVKIWKGIAEGGIIEDPDSIVSAPGNSTYPEMLPNVRIADINGDGKGDLILGSTFEIAPYGGIEPPPFFNVSNDWGKIDLGGLPALDPGMVQILLGRSPWPARLSTSSADARIMEEKAQDELGRLTTLNLVTSDYNNDGYEDMLVSAPRAVYDVDARVYRGKAYLFLGQADMGTDEAWDEMPAGDADMIFVFDGEQDIMGGTVLWDAGDLFNDGNPDVLIAAGRRAGAALYIHSVSDDSQGVFGPSDASSIVTLNLR